jgi:hypothetical protein
MCHGFEACSTQLAARVRAFGSARLAREIRNLSGGVPVA